MKQSIPWKQASIQELAAIRGICLDIDETLSTRGKLTSEAYAALWKLKSAGFRVVPITGRPAGWCDHIARFWPVDGIIGENGAFSFFMHQGRLERLKTPQSPESPREKIQELANQILKVFPSARWASDQAYREYDLAIDFCEDVPRWPQDEIQNLVEICEQAGAHAKVSSIHVNAWFGDYDKYSGFTHFLQKCALPDFPSLTEWLFIGDSPNDEPLFARFDHSVGVANLKEFSKHLRHPPRYLTEAESGAGFCEMADKMVQIRSESHIK